MPCTALRGTLCPIAAHPDMVPETFHEFFLGSAGVAGALIGLLFVAVSVAPERITAATADRPNQVRASAALTAFSNALGVSLFALIPGIGFDKSVLVIATIGLAFVVSSILALRRDRRDWRLPRADLVMVLGLVVVFGVQWAEGLRMAIDGVTDDPVSTVAVLVCVCFFVGIGRAWELIGGPSIRLGRELRATLEHDEEPPADS